MANGIDVDTGGNPWIITFHSNGGTALPATIVGVQNTGNQAYPIMPKRIQWISKGAAQGDGVILKDVPGIGGAGTARKIFETYATGADFDYMEARPRARESFVGLQVTQMDSGVLYIYI